MENKWEYKENFHKIPMSEDYDGHYEVTNGKISLCTIDDPEDLTDSLNTLQRVANALNDSGCKFYCNTTTEHALHIENMALKAKIERYEAALKELIRLKNLKDKEGKTYEYLVKQPLAWKAATEALSAGEGNKEVNNG